jgi:tryptophanyl-tRNA synthetase
MKKRIFSGIKPTGDMHLGNYLGAIKNWVTLQDEYDCVYSIVDLHAMTTEYDPIVLKKNVFKLACSLLACGLDPQKSILMIQSSVKYHAELCWILNCLTPVSWAERVPTYKEKAQLNDDNLNIGLLDYPILQTADIILYKAEAVPVGEDQLPHIEISREIIRRFNARFGDTFPETKGIVGSGARVRGLDDSAKMGKSLDNCVYLYEDYDSMWKKISRAVTDTNRVKKTDVGNPDVCNIFSYHKLFSSTTEMDHVSNGCRTAEIGCIDCKKVLTQNINAEMETIRSKYFDYYNKPDVVYDIFNDGNSRANEIATVVMNEVYEKIGIKYPFLKK